MSVVKSMTAYASLHEKCIYGSLTIDIKSVNSKYFEIFFKLPDNLKFLESKLRDILNASNSRGKFEIIISFVKDSTSDSVINTEALDKLSLLIKTIQDKIPNATCSALDILNTQGIIQDAIADESFVNDFILNNFKKCVDTYNEAKISEGTRLKSIILDKISLVKKQLLPVKDMLDTLVTRQREKLLQKIKKLQIDLPDDRIEAEIALLAQKFDIAEEYDRLQSHLKGVEDILNKGGICGKRLDFMMQELNRESNTMASKSSGIDITQITVELKVLIEQMREQIQNIE